MKWDEQAQKDQIIVELVELFIDRIRQTKCYDPQDLIKELESLAEKIVEDSLIRLQEMLEANG
jgi:flagellar motor component MotA